ncbi:hypothetical protein Tco_1568143 [Tanacetum coccineum]
MFRATLKLPVETLEQPFIPISTIEYIQPFLKIVGYLGFVDKVCAFYTNNLARPWHTMFKVFNRCLTSRTSGPDQTKINILQIFHAQKKNVIQNRRFAKLSIANIMTKFKSISKILEEDYHSIKDHISLAYKDYEEKFEGVDVPTIQPNPVESTQGTNRTPKATRKPNPADVFKRRREKEHKML